MKITYLSEYDFSDPDAFSGTSFWIAKGLEQEGVQLNKIHVDYSLKFLPPFEELAFRCKQLWFQIIKRSHLAPDWDSRRARHIASWLNRRINHLKSDAILTPLAPMTPAYLETNIPIVYWTDAVYTALAVFYPLFRFHDPITHWEGHMVTQACLRNAKLLIFSSQWAARTAVEFYGINKDKIKVVPYGANLDILHSLADVKDFIRSRSKKTIKLLFVGKDWYRKGGDTALKVAEELHKTGHPVELTLVGCQPKIKLPAYVKCEPFISKKKPEDLQKLRQLYSESHFLLLPSRAECCAIVFGEANAFGLPCLTSYVGGIPEAIKDDINGMTFALEAEAQQYCDYILRLMTNPQQYESLALSAFNEYQTRLNWQTVSRQVKDLIAEVI